jgi:hypothetical protein
MSAPPRRVVVGLDTSRESLAAAAAAAEVAAALDAELAALFVEDAELLRLAAAPLATVVDRLSARSRPLLAAEIEHELRAASARARADLERLLAGRALRWSFRVARGGVAAELLAAAADRDPVVLGRVGAGGAGQGLGRTARAVAAGRDVVVTVRRGDAGGAGRLVRPLATEPREVVPLRDGGGLPERLRELLDSGVTLVLLVD